MTFRYSKLKLFYDMLDLIKNNLFILFILFLNAGSNSMFMNIVQWGAIAVFGFSFLFRIYETLFTKVVFAEDGIHIHKGLFSKSEHLYRAKNLRMCKRRQMFCNDYLAYNRSQWKQVKRLAM